jgi:UPF0755 protein
VSEENRPEEQGLIPDEVLGSVFDDLEDVPGVNVEEDTRNLDFPSSSSQWPTFDWEAGNRSWDSALIQYRFPEQTPPPTQGVLPEPEAEPEKEPEEYSPAGKAPLTFAESFLAVLVYVAGVMLCSFLIATVGWRWANDVLALNKPAKTVSLTISKGDTIEDVARNLKTDGLIEYPALFKTFAAVTGKANQITTGTYELTTEMDYSALLNSFRKTSPARETADITIPEGYTLDEVFQLLEQAGVCSADDLRKSAEEDSFDYPFFKGVERTGAHRLEGYLFPDTYQFYKGSQAHAVLVRLLNNFQTRFDSVMDAQQQLSGYSVDEIVIMASIVEKETTGEDRSDIAGVIYNRLNNPDHDDISGRLQMDSTVQYVLPHRKAHLTNDDIAIESPYNTYVVQGLPAGPICNPGLDSLRSVLNPTKHEYYYFMLGDDGEDHFFKSKSSFEDFKSSQKGPQEEEEPVEEETEN